MNPNPLLGPSGDSRRRAEQFNRECACVTLNREAMRAELLGQPDGADLYRMIAEERPHLFADSPVFIPEACVRRQTQIIAAAERVVALPAYQERVLAHAPATARFVPKARGVFLGYDFHLGAEGSRLIEINTNAGGALLNALLTRAQFACCDSTTMGGGEISELGGTDRQQPEQRFLAMFLEEWQLERNGVPLRSIAIVDEDPWSQFLLPEFLLFRNLFEGKGITTVICDPRELVFREGGLWHEKQRIDLVYNRLTDFGLTKESSRNLREAYLAGAVVVTPHPRAHALYADKRNLIVLSDETALLDMGVDAETRALLLEGVAHTIAVRREEADQLWAARKRLFFKPAAGYGSKAAYRGDKLTRRVFDEILQGDYVAQAFVPPSERRLQVDAEPADFKLDLRNFVYDGRVQMIATRLYQGQTTNFRTTGGGFASVVVVPILGNTRPAQGKTSTD
jgi:glutathione synthase/RimK-type ligase-like ATP-grasp enzyme